MRTWKWSLSLAGALLGGSLLLGACGPKYPSCTVDEHCNQGGHEGEYCILQQCQECRHADDCGSSQRCLETSPSEHAARRDGT